MKRMRSADTVAGAVKDFLDVAKGTPACPAHVKLRKQDIPYWNSILTHRSRDEWTEVELVAAAQLARTQADIATWSDQLDRETAIITVGPNDSPRANPLLRIIEDATRRELALFRMLGLSTPLQRDNILRRQRLFEEDAQKKDGAVQSVDDLLA